MNQFTIPSRRMCFAAACLIFGMFSATKLWADNPPSAGELDFSTEIEGQATLILQGTEQRIGRYMTYAELDFVAGQDEGTQQGEGVIVLTAANGDMLVGVATALLDLDSGMVGFHFSWRDSVTLRDGTIVSNTGRFAQHRPPGLVVVGTVPEQSLLVKLIIIILR